MSNPNVKSSDQFTLAGVVDPEALTAATHSSGWVSMSDYDAVMALIAVGDLGAAALVDAKLEQATDSSGTGVKDITGKAITQLTDADSPNDANVQAIIECRDDELDVDNDFTHVRLSITVATATTDGAGFLFGVNHRYQPPTALASVVEVVSS